MLENTYWNNTGKFNDEYTTLYAALVPDTGPSNTLEGELLRASSKCYYDHFNNGSCNNTSGAAKFLIKHMSTDSDILDALRVIVAESNTGGYTTVDMEKELELVADHVIEYVISKNGTYTPFDGDMYDLQDETVQIDDDDDDAEYMYCDDAYEQN